MPVLNTLDSILIRSVSIVGDADEVSQELIALVPDSWTSPDAKQQGGIFWTLMVALAQALQVIKDLTDQAKLELRVLTAGGKFLDIISQDFFGASPDFRLPRAFQESDNTFRDRIEAELLRPHATPPAIIAAVESVTGAAPSFFEPFNVLGTGSWGGAWRTGGATFADNQVEFGIGGYASNSLDMFNLPDGSIGGLNPQTGINAMGDLGSASAYTFFVTVTVNPKMASVQTIAAVVARVKPVGTVGYVTYGGVTIIV